MVLLLGDKMTEFLVKRFVKEHEKIEKMCDNVRLEFLDKKIKLYINKVNK